MKQAVCTRCSIGFSYSPEDRSGKFCTFLCWTKYRTDTSRYKGEVVNGYRRTLYPIVCLNCGTSKDAIRKTAKYCSARCQLAYEYRTGHRDKTTIAAAAHESIRKNGQPKKRGVPMKPRPQSVYNKISATKLAKHAAYRREHGLPDPDEKRKIVNSREYRHWRLAVYQRDGYTCVLCGDAQGGNLEADHIKPRHLFPELTFDVSNGRTLCKPCHKQTSTYGARVTLLSRDDFDLAA